MIRRVQVTDVRPQLTQLLGRVENGSEKLLLTRYGKPVAALVSMADFDRVWDAEEEELYGPRDPKTGRRPGPILRASAALKGRGWNWWRVDR